VLDLLQADGVLWLPSCAGLAGGLRAWLEDAAFALLGARGDTAPPLVLGPRHLLGPAFVVSDLDSGAGGGDGTRAADLARELVVSRLVHALFRQIVTVGTLDDPLRDATDAVRVDGRRSDGLVRQVEGLSSSERRALGRELSAHAAHLLALVARPAPEWQPRTDDHVAIPLAGGRIVLHGVFDLLVDLDAVGGGTRGALTLSTDGAWGRARRSLHYLALLETLRSGTPPLRLALVDSSSGRSGVEDVREEHLRAMTAHVCAWLAGASWGPVPPGG
jgi:hypothetical protein